MTSASPIGQLLRTWRAARGMSQLELAIEAGISPRHLSFVETGRSSPSRELLILLSDTLAVPLRERNALLLAAGYAPLYRETPLDAPEMAQVHRALEQILKIHGSFPALVINARYDVLRANDAASALVRTLLPKDALPSGPPNLLRLLLSEHCLRDSIDNWEEVAVTLFQRVQRETLSEPARVDLQVLLRDLLGSETGLPQLQKLDLARPLPLLIPMKFRVGSKAMSMFSTITTLGTPLDITLSELRIEAMFPADEQSELLLRQIVSAVTAP